MEKNNPIFCQPTVFFNENCVKGKNEIKTCLLIDSVSDQKKVYDDRKWM